MAGSNPLVLPAEMSIIEVESLQAQFQAAMAEQDSLVISASLVERIDTAAMQLLATLCLTCSQQHLPVVWQDPSDIFLMSARLLGVSSALGISTDAQ